MRALDNDLRLLAARGSRNTVEGILSVTAGLGIGVLGYMLEPPFRELLMSSGAVSVGRGLVQLFVLADPEDASLEFEHMRMDSLQAVQARVAFGETALSDIAHRARIARLLDGGLAIAGGAVLLTLYVGPFSDESTDEEGSLSPEQWLAVIGAGASVIGGLVTMLTRTPAEKRWQAYKDLTVRMERNRLRPARHPAARVSLGLGRPLRFDGQALTGLTMKASLRF